MNMWIKAYLEYEDGRRLTEQPCKAGTARLTDNRLATWTEARAERLAVTAWPRTIETWTCGEWKS